MSPIAIELARIQAEGLKVYWLGACSEVGLAGLEQALGCPLPATFREFLSATGGGEIALTTISGVKKSDPTLVRGGTVWGDTARCRREFGLPPQLAVIHFEDDETCWCLDTSKRDATGECPVVTYDVFNRGIDNVIAPNFAAFLKEFIDHRILENAEVGD